MAGRGGALMLLRSDQVQAELKLTEAQKAKVNELAEKMRAEFQERFGNRERRRPEGGDRERPRPEGGDRERLTPEEREARQAEMQKAMEARAAKVLQQAGEILKPEQMKRLKQIQLQLEGPAALRRPEIAEAIGLSKDQLAQLEKVAEESREAIGQLWQGPRRERGDRDERASREAREQRFAQLREKMKQIDQELKKRSMAVLTSEQKQKLGEIFGEPFELDRSQLFRGPEGRRGSDDRGDRRGPRDEAPPRQ